MTVRLSLALASTIAATCVATPVALTAAPVAAATADGTISGVVTHAKTDARIAGALVVLSCTCLDGERETQTNDEGLYAFRGLPPGTYTVQVLVGQSDVSKVTTLQRDAKFRANFRLDPKQEFKRAVRVMSSSVPMSASAQGYSLRDGMRDMAGASSGPATATRRTAAQRLAEHRRDAVAVRTFEDGTVTNTPPGVAAPTSADAATPEPEAVPATTPLQTDFARQVVYSGAMQLAVFEPQTASEAIEAIVVEAGGYVASLKADAMVLRIPAKDFRAIAGRIGKLGRIESQAFEALDVTADYYDLETRIAILRQTQTQLMTLLGEARDVTQALEVRRELDKVVLELETALGRQRVMAAMLHYSTLSLGLQARLPRTDAPSTNDPFPWVDEIGVEGTAWR